MHTPDLATSPGAFTADWPSLRARSCPPWFSEAKLGIWAHWGPQGVPRQGDWYARWLYGPYAGTEAWERENARSRREFHEAHFGHPSRFGHKDICHLWKAERFDPAGLMQLYKRAGARYFVSMAAHSDNYDLWASTHQPWNATRVGPGMDIVGMWAKAARNEGLPFGVSLHSAWAWRWLIPAFGTDESGPLAGVRYDGHLRKEDGKGTWWEGLDPRDLYGPPRQHGEPPDAEFCANFYARARDLVSQHNPDLVYFDDARFPFDTGSVSPARTECKLGLDFAAWYYNRSKSGIINIKHVPDEDRNAVVLDIERGQIDALQPWPWQTDTCIGDWYYRDGAPYKSAKQVVQMLVDIVSKNGSLLLNVPQKPDGSIDEQAGRLLGELGAWMDINAQAIHGTTRWRVYGEGPTQPIRGHFTEKELAYTAHDIRFTRRGQTLYAIVMAWPADAQVRITELPSAVVKDVSLLGSDARLTWNAEASGLRIALPPTPPCKHAFALCIEQGG